METIINYVETMFINLPETAELQQLKQDILLNMEDKYNELKAAGKSENEAVGTVISEFGNLDEILDELDSEGGQFEEDVELLPVVDMAEASNYVAVRRKTGFNIACGVLFCMLGVASLLAVQGWANGNEQLELIGLVPLFLLAAVGVGLFIVSGFRLKPFEYMEKSFVLTGTTRKEIDRQKETYYRSYVVSITAGVMICIISMAAIFVAEALAPDNDQMTLYAISIMLLIASIGVFLIVYAGNVQGAYTTLLEKGKNRQPTKEELQRRSWTKKIASVVWTATTAVYLLAGILFGAWGKAWILFAIVGIISSFWETDDD